MSFFYLSKIWNAKIVTDLNISEFWSWFHYIVHHIVPTILEKYIILPWTNFAKGNTPSVLVKTRLSQFDHAASIAILFFLQANPKALPVWKIIKFSKYGMVYIYICFMTATHWPMIFLYFSLINMTLNFFF